MLPIRHARAVEDGLSHVRTALSPAEQASYDVDERAAILEFEAGLSRAEADAQAAQYCTACELPHDPTLHPVGVV